MHLHIANLGQQITEESLLATFAAYGTVAAAEIMMDGFTGQSRGFGYVSMPDNGEAVLATQKINGSVIDGNTVVVTETKPRVIHRGSYPIGRRSNS